MSSNLSTFTPYLCDITAVTNSYPSTITFLQDHGFKLGEFISLRSSTPYGMVEINNAQVKVLSSTSNTVTVDLDTTNFTPFVYPPIGKVQYLAVAVPSASGTDPTINLVTQSATVILDDAFDNVPTF